MPPEEMLQTSRAEHMHTSRARSAPARRRPQTAKAPPPPPLTDEQKATTEYAPVRKMVAKVGIIAWGH